MIREEDLIQFKKQKVRQDFKRREKINEFLLIHP